MNNGNNDFNNESLTSEDNEKALAEANLLKDAPTEEKTDVNINAPSSSDGADNTELRGVTNVLGSAASINAENTGPNMLDGVMSDSYENGNTESSENCNGRTADSGNNEGEGAFNSGFYGQAKDGQNAAERLNSYLFSTDTPAKIKPPKKDTDALKRLWKTAGVLLLTMAVAFSGAFACFYWVCETALLGDSDFFRTLMVQASGIKVNKVEIDMISGGYEEDSIALAEKIMQSSIDIQIFNTENQRAGSGSGVIISEDGLAVTNYHVVYGNETTLKAVLSDGTVCALSVLHLDKITDLAVVKIDTNKKLTPVTWADSANAKAGQSIAVCGNPLGLGFSVSFGKIGHPNRDLGEVAGSFIQIDASVNPGNSGGGLYDGAGNLLGIINSKASGTNVDGIGYAIPASRALSVISELLNPNLGYVTGRPAIGFTLVQVSQSTWDYFKNGDGINPGELKDHLYEAKYGIYIIKSEYNTEIVKGDRIISCNGIEFDDRDEFSQWLMKFKPGDTVSVTVERIVEKIHNPDGSYTVKRQKFTFPCVLRERDWKDEPYAK